MEDDLLDQKKEEEERLLLEMERREHDEHHSEKAGGSNKNASSRQAEKKKTVEGRAIGKESPASAPSNPSNRKGMLALIPNSQCYSHHIESLVMCRECDFLCN